MHTQWTTSIFKFGGAGTSQFFLTQNTCRKARKRQVKTMSLQDPDEVYGQEDGDFGEDVYIACA